MLRDFSSTGKKRPWQEKKLKSQFVADSFSRLGDTFVDERFTKRARKIVDCGTYLEFKQFSDNSLKLHRAFFCKARLCPMCAWRRSLKIYGQLCQIMHEAVKEGDFAYLFLTLTVKNCDEAELSDTITQMIKAYGLIFKRKELKNSVLGAFRALEITYNEDADTFHPHFHCILMVPKSYFGRGYISQERFGEIWREALGVDYQPIVDVRRIKEDSIKDINHAVAETAKYSVKDDDLIHADDEKMDKVVFTLDEAMHGRRLVSFRGKFKEIAERLKLDDAIDGDLVHTNDDDVPNPEDLYKIVAYVWRRSAGAGGYLNYFFNGEVTK